MKIIAIIPARMASTRFPGKPLEDILGLPMIEHVRRRVQLCSFIEEVFVATCDREIFDVVTGNGGKAVMTADTHERCTDRIAEAAQALKADIVVNVQGDEPMVRPEMLEALVAPLLSDRNLICTNLMNEITDEREFVSPDVVKTVCDKAFNALYFSREPVPSVKKAGGESFKKYKQLGIVAFEKKFLHLFSSLPPTPLEVVESVDMLRAIEHGYKVRMVLTNFRVSGVDTRADLERVEYLMKDDDIKRSYMREGN